MRISNLQSATPARKLSVISLFSGAGGLDIAVENAGRPIGEPLSVRDASVSPYRVAVATDYDDRALRTFSANFPTTKTVLGDIRSVGTEELLREGGVSAGDISLVVGGPPCTPFSKSGFWLAEKRESRDPNASLLEEYVRVVAETRPEGFVLENVQALTYKTHAPHFQRLLEALRQLGYNPQWKVLLAADYGVPQLRKRVFIVGRRDGKAFEFPEPTHAGPSETSRTWDTSKLPHVTASAAFSGLDTPAAADETVGGKYGELAAEVPPGQNYLWHSERYEGRNEFKWRSRYWTFLLRLHPDRPSTTLQAQPGPYVGPFHWENKNDSDGNLRARRLRDNEILRLMSFPDDFILTGNRADRQRQLGNAVPARLGQVVVRALGIQLGHIDADVV